MKIKQTISFQAYETKISLDQLKDIFNADNISEFFYDDKNDGLLVLMRTENKSTIREIISYTEYDGRIIVDLVDMLEINL